LRRQRKGIGSVTSVMRRSSNLFRFQSSSLCNSLGQGSEDSAQISKGSRARPKRRVKKTVKMSQSSAIMINVLEVRRRKSRKPRR